MMQAVFDQDLNQHSTATVQMKHSWRAERLTEKGTKHYKHWHCIIKLACRVTSSHSSQYTVGTSKKTDNPASSITAQYGQTSAEQLSPLPCWSDIISPDQEIKP